jgi:cytochrome c peroxidase
LLASVLAVGCNQVKAKALSESGSVRTQSSAVLSVASLGQQLFFDTNLSEPAGQACATCHDPNYAFTDGRGYPTSQGALADRFGVRNTPSIVYASFNPPLAMAGDETGYSGGLFWDGRARTLEAQAGGPLLNALEMNNADKAAVIAKVRAASYAADFQTIFGATVFDDVDQAFAHLTEAIAEFERSGIPGRFTSKYDAYLAGTAQLSDAETRGLQIFEDPARGNCASCHLDKPDQKGNPPLFTDFGYDNLGIPKNPDNPFYGLSQDLNPAGADYLDNGLGGSLHNPRQFGRFKAPSLRNVELTAPYGHNGYFWDLRAVVDFYNTRDVQSAGWPAAEVELNKNVKDMGNLGLSDRDADDLVAFMLTLTDGYVAPTP